MLQQQQHEVFISLFLFCFENIQRNNAKNIKKKNKKLTYNPVFLLTGREKVLERESRVGILFWDSFNCKAVWHNTTNIFVTILMISLHNLFFYLFLDFIFWLPF